MLLTSVFWMVKLRPRGGHPPQPPPPHPLDPRLNVSTCVNRFWIACPSDLGWHYPIQQGRVIRRIIYEGRDAASRKRMLLIAALANQALFLGESHQVLRFAIVIATRGAPKGRAQGARALPLGPKKHWIFSVSSVKLRDFCLCNTCSKAVCYVEGPRKAVAW